MVYQGEILAEKGQPEATRKSFAVQYFVAPGEESQREVWWVLKEQGRGSWDWPHQFGVFLASAEGRYLQGSRPRLRYRRDDGTSVVSVTLPMLETPEALQAGASWRVAEGLTYTVIDQRDSGQNSGDWELEGEDAYGKRRWLRYRAGDVVSARDKVVMGRGERYEMTVRQTEASRLSADQWQTLHATLNSLRTLLAPMNLPADAVVDWTGAQIGLLREKLPAVDSVPEELQDFLAVAHRDTLREKSEQRSVAAMQKQAVGKRVEFQLTAIDGKPMRSQQFANQVVLLHFWDYQDKPLEQPYGQIGYLDFLWRRQRPENFQLLGVAAHESLENAETRPQGIVNAKKLRSFMNLSYPIAVDNGLLAKIGDPRTVGGKLPLFVLLDGHGKVLLYHSGLYQVDPQRGLEELTKQIQAAVKAATKE